MRHPSRGRHAGARTGGRKPRTTDQAMHRLELAGGFATEQLEHRLLLSATLRAAITAQVDPNTATQAIFVPGVTNTQLNRTGFSIASTLYRFSLDQPAGQTVTFSTSKAPLFNAPDTALALYDADGNLLQSADADNPTPVDESLTATVQPRQPYLIDVYSLNFGASTTYNFTVDTHLQRVNSGIAIDRTTGTADFVADSGEDTFVSPADVNYFPLDLTNAGTSETVTLNAVGPDTQMFASVFRQDPTTLAWQPISSGSGAPVTVTATPSGGQNVTDFHYMLGVAPRNLNSAAQPYSIDIEPPAAALMVGPATVDPAGATDLGPLLPSAPGVADITTNSSFPANGSKLFKTTALVNGPLNLLINYSNNILAAPTVMSVYDSTGQTLLGAATGRAGRSAQLTLNATAGSTYLIRVGANPTPPGMGGNFPLDVNQTYAPTPITVGTTIAQQAGLTIGPGSPPQVFRMTPPPGSDLLVLRLAADAGADPIAPTVRVFGTNQPVVTKSAAAGGTVLLSVNLAAGQGPVDVYVAGTSGSGTATFSYAALSIPKQIAIDQLPNQRIDINTGALSTSVNAAPFGQMAGLQFYQISAGNTTLTAQGSAGVQPLLLRYVQQGGILSLDDRAFPDDTGKATLTKNLQGTLIYAEAAVTLNLDGTGTVQLSASEPPPSGAGVQMAPVPRPTLPGDPPAQPPFSSQLRIRNVTLSRTVQRDLWETLLPFDITGNPVVTFSPVTAASPLSATVTVLDGSNNVVASGTSQPGQTLTINLTAVTPGQKLRFLVEPVAGQPLGDGIYNLQMVVPTADPNPYLLTESSINSNGTLAPLPFGGSVAGSFASTQPATLFYAITLPNAQTPFQVWTQDTTQGVNTDIKLFRAHWIFTARPFPHNVIDRYDQLPNASANFDYYPADRSTIDAKVVVNNWHILDHAWDDDPNQTDYSPGVNTVYVAVRNEQGTQGSFQINAGPVPVNLVGPGSPAAFNPTDVTDLIMDPESGQTATKQFLIFNNLVRFDTPSGLSSNPQFTVQSPNFTDTATITLYDSSGNFLASSSAPVAGFIGIVPFAYGMSSSSLYYFRVSLSSGASASVTVSANVSTSSSPNKPTQTDALTSTNNVYSEVEPFKRLIVGPDGSFTGGRVVFGGGTIDKEVFWVGQPGSANFSVLPRNVINASFALYRGEIFGGGEFTNLGGQLVDFSSTPNFDGSFSFNDYLVPGMYYLKLVGNLPNFAFTGSDTVTGQIPPFNAQHIDLDPSSGRADISQLLTVDPADFWRTDLYQVTAPAGAQGDLSVTLTGTQAASVLDGEASIGIFKANGFFGYQQVGGTAIVTYDTSTKVTTVTIHSQDAPAPGDQYFISVNRDRMSQDLLVGPAFTRPQSDDPDLVVTGIQLLPDNGHTRATVTVINQSFAVAPNSHAKLVFSNYRDSVLLNEAAVGQFGNITFTTDWDPDLPSNIVSFTANYDRTFQEFRFDNNQKQVALSTVDPAAPTVQAPTLADPTLNAEGSTWGRYVSGVSGVQTHLRFSASDTDGNLYQTRITGPIFGGAIAGGGSFGASHLDDILLDFGSLQPTSSANPNVIHFTAIDTFGLHAVEAAQKIDVVPRSQFFTAFTWDPVNKVYDLGFNHDIVDLEGTINDLVHKIVDVNVPVVGDKNNVFKINLHANGTAGLDPTKSVSFPLFAELLIKALDTTIWNPSIGGTQQLTDHLTLRSSVEVSGRTLDATAAAFSLQLQNLSLLHLQSPVLKLFSFGIPDVLSLDAGIGFGLDANLSAGVKIGINPNFLVDPLHAPLRAGLMSPTFVEPSISGSATVEGDVDVLSFDAAALKGTVTVGLDLTFGLDNNDTSKVIPFSDILDHLGLKIGLTVGVHLEADVILLGDVWDYDYSHTFTASLTNQGIITHDPADGGAGNANAASQLGTLLSNPASLLQNATLDGAPPVVRKGSDPLGPYRIDPTPQIVIDPATGDGLSVQVQNVSADPNVTTGNLMYSTRSNGQWSALAPLPGGDVGNPQLAFSHDSNNLNPAVVVYEADNGAADPATQTLNQRLNDLEIRYRYYDGQGNWSDEQSITADSLNDSSPSVAFNATGAGVVAWVHNTSSTPMDESGNYSRNTQDIQAAIWDPATRTFSAPMSITSGDGVADSKPATFVDADGNPYVVWVRDGQGTANTLMYSVFDGQHWSQPAVLPITGLAPGGNFGSVALGTDKLGRINVIFSYRVQNADGSIDSRLFNRPATKDQFGNAAPVEQIAQDGNFSHLRTTNAGDGSLIAYWQLGDGVNDGVYESTLARSAASPSLPWSSPTRLTSTTDLTQTPSLALDANGNMDVLFADSVANGAAAAATVSDVPVGVPLAPGVGSSSVAQLPELTFSNGLFFPFQDSAAQGTSATGQATILNRGAAAATVTIKSYVGLPDTGTLINTRTINLAPGHTYDFSQAFPVSPGQTTYSVAVSTPSGEAISTDDDVSTATLNGLPDLMMVSLTPQFGAPLPGGTATMIATVKNLSGAAVGPFDVELLSGDPHFPQTNPTVIATRTVASLGANATTTVSFTGVHFPSTAGTYVFTALADPANAIAEAVETNNDAQYRGVYTADPAIVATGTVIGRVAASLLNTSGVNNVRVTAPVGNLGDATLINLPVVLQLSRNGGPFVDVATQTVASLNAHTGTSLTFTTSGLAGDNIYRVIIDHSFDAIDSNIENNFDQAELIIHGLADLTVGAITLSNPQPQQGDPLTVSAIIQNLGIADATSALVELVAVPASGPEFALGSVHIDVPALSSTTATIHADTSSLAPGTYTLRVQVNRDHAVLETTELNNSNTIPLTIVGTIPPNNIVNALPGSANTITLRRDPNGTEDDVWVNIPVTSAPTQVALISQPITINGSGNTDTLVLDTSNGDPIPIQLILNGSFTTGALTVNANEVVTLGDTAAINGNQLSATALTIDPAGTVDLGDGSISISYSGAAPLAQIQAYLHEGFAGGAWNGDGITSGDAQSNRRFAIGYADSADGLVSGQAADTLLLRYTRVGDTNLDGSTNFADLLALAQHYSRPTAKWSDGDLNYDGTVNFADLLGLAQNYGQSAAVAAAASAVPTDDTLSSILTKLRRPTTRRR